MEIYNYLKEFLKNPTMLQIGTRDEKLRPFMSMFCSASFNEEPDILLVHVRDTGMPQLMNNLANNGQITAVITNVITYECIQVKGQTTHWRPATITEQTIHNDFIHRLRSFEYPENVFRMKKSPLITIAVAIREIFDQTPGPEAGERIKR